MQTRPATTDDLPRLAEIYQAAVRAIGPQRYTEAQVEAWAGFAQDPSAFAAKLDGAICLVADDGGEIAGFVTFEPAGVIGLLYVHPDRMRQGIGSALLVAAIDRATAFALKRLTTVASQFSRPLFERHAFSVYQTEHADYNGQTFFRYLMQRDLAQGPQKKPRFT